MVEHPYNEGTHIIPMPREMEVQEEGSFTLSKNISFVAPEGELTEVAKFFADKVKTSTGFNWQVIGESKNPKQEIALEIVGADVVPNAEGYILKVSKEGIKIQGQTPRGIFWGCRACYNCSQLRLRALRWCAM